MRLFYADLHVHIGSARGKPVKITASRQLTLENIIFRDAPIKGLDIVGVVDTCSPLVSAEIEAMLEKGDLHEGPQGGFLAPNGVMLIAACEIETCEGIHIIIYLPNFNSIQGVQKYLRSRVTNPCLSTQVARCKTVDLINLSVLFEGILCPAHVFTPHKGIYGCLTSRLSEALGKAAGQIKVLELGLSADTEMADCIAETCSLTFLSNSDAHSPANLGREYNLLRMKSPSFRELRLCLEKSAGRSVAANYGLDPWLGKYHRSYCRNCQRIAVEPAPVFQCPRCGGDDIVMGVYDRIVAIRDYQQPRHPMGRPPYHYRVPLKDLPGVGPNTLNRLLQAFPSEIYISEHAPLEKIAKVARPPLADLIARMRQGRLPIEPGGGGRYGKVLKG